VRLYSPRAAGLARRSLPPHTGLTNASIDARWRLSLSLSVPTLAADDSLRANPVRP
jgi:hypothetical protein